MRCFDAYSWMSSTWISASSEDFFNESGQELGSLVLAHVEAVLGRRVDAVVANFLVVRGHGDVVAVDRGRGVGAG